MSYFRLAFGLALVLALVAITPRPADAHARYERSEPAGESVVPSAPSELRAWFTEELRTQGSSLEVMDAAGNRVDVGDSRVDLNDPDRKLMRVSLPPLADGVYTVRWQTTSGHDGDAADGSFRFGVGANTMLPPLAASGPTPRLTIERASGHAGEVHVHLAVDAVRLAEPTMALDLHRAAERVGYAGPVEGHLHVYLDGQDVLHTWENEFTLSGVSPGPHQLMLELHAPDHRLYDPPVVATVDVVVAE